MITKVGQRRLAACFAFVFSMSAQAELVFPEDAAAICSSLTRTVFPVAVLIHSSKTMTPDVRATAEIRAVGMMIDDGVHYDTASSLSRSLVDKEVSVFSPGGVRPEALLVYAKSRTMDIRRRCMQAVIDVEKRD